MERPTFLHLIQKYLAVHPVVALLGPRQCGKTTLAKIFGEGKVPRSHYFDLEDPADLQRLSQPKVLLHGMEGLIVIDEVQRMPELFPLLRVLVDQSPNKKFLILGSASRDLIRQSSETLAGRIAFIELTPFSYSETHSLDKLWLRGGFPRSFLAADEEQSFLWREFYITTFLERDIPGLGIAIPPESLRRFWTMLAHYHGNIFNASEMGRSFGASDITMRKYLDILVGTFMVRRLQPWYENVKKRQVKSPKIYFRDCGIYHALMHIKTKSDLLLHPKMGASWEGFALEEIARLFNGQCYFWKAHSGAELDLLVIYKGKRVGFEFKYSDAPKITKSMKISLQDLQLEKLFVIYPGDVEYPLADKVEVCGLLHFLDKRFSEIDKSL